jgi:hypothetical protein
MNLNTNPTKKKMSFSLVLAIVAASALAPTLLGQVWIAYAQETKDILFTLVDRETGDKVSGECQIFTNTGQSTFKETNAGGQGRVTVEERATSATFRCFTAAGVGFATVPLEEDGVTRVTIFV